MADSDEVCDGDVRQVFASLRAAAYVWNIDSDAIVWSGEPETLLGVASRHDIATGRRYSRFIDPSGPAGRYEAIHSGVADAGDGVAYDAHYRFRPPGTGVQDECWIEDIGRWYAAADGRPARAEGMIRIVDDRRVREARRRARGGQGEDSSRRRILEAVDAALALATAENASCALAVIAVDNLGPLNDAYGHDVGDDLIAGAVARIERELRRDDTLGRLSGNKIGVVLNRCTEADLRVAADRFVRAVSAAPMSTPIGAAGVTVSVGGVVLPRHARARADAVSLAQEALVRARRYGAGSVAIHAPAPGRDAERRHSIRLAADLIAALNAGRISLALQPIVPAGGGEPVMHEALSRLQTEGEPIGAAAFIETAERLGIIRLVDHRMLELSIAALDAHPALSLSVNVSAGSALDGTWYAGLAAHVRRRPGLPSRLVVEITETTALTDPDRAAAFVRALHDLGCRVAIDDFGAGHTSFRSLRSLGADIVKIDGAFAENVAGDADNRMFVETLVRLAGHMGMQTVAEHVDSERDAAVLRRIGIDMLQGHLFGAARPLDDPPLSAQIASV